MAAVVAPDQSLTERHDESLAVVGEFEDLLQIVVDDPHVLLGIVGIDLDVMRSPRTLPMLVPLGPGLHDVPVAIGDVHEVLAAYRSVRLIGIAGRPARRPVKRQEFSPAPLWRRHLAALDEEDPIRRLGEDRDDRPRHPALVVGQRLGPVRHDLVLAGLVAAALLL